MALRAPRCILFAMLIAVFWFLVVLLILFTLEQKETVENLLHVVNYKCKPPGSCVDLRQKQSLVTADLLQKQLLRTAKVGLSESVVTVPPAHGIRESLPSPTASTDLRTELDIAVCLPWAVRNPPSIANTVRHLVSSPGLPRDRFGIFVWRSWPARDDQKTYDELLKLGVYVETAEEEYSELMGPVRITRRDPPDQMRWRLRHVLDYANMLQRCAASKARFCLAIEDDLLPAKEAIGKAFDFGAAVIEGETWSHATLYSGVKRVKNVEDITRAEMRHGNVALLFHCHALAELVAYLRKEAFEWPPDVLNHHFFVEVKRGRIFERTPNLFQHASPVSTYTGKNSKLRSSEKWRSRTFRLDEAKDMSTFPIRTRDRYVGCFHDNDTNPTLRDLTGLYYGPGDKQRASTSVEFCRHFCKEYLYFGLQRGGDCFCGNEFGRHGVAARSACSMRCPHGHSECGGSLHNSIYAV